MPNEAKTALDKSDESKREYDINDWPTIHDNPVTRAGVAQYLGSQIHASLQQDKLYGVLKPVEELSSQKTLDSFKLVPFTIGHTMLGEGDLGLTPAEQKGVQGVIGETVYFDPKTNQVLANLKIFSERLKKLIQQEKVPLSLGYRCDFVLESGVYEGSPYVAIQRNMRGNHIAAVGGARMGKEIAVLDSSTPQGYALDEMIFTCDNTDNTNTTLTGEKIMTFDEMKGELQKASDRIAELETIVKDEAEAKAKDEAEAKAKDDEAKAKDEAEEKAKDDETKAKDDEAKAKDYETKAKDDETKAKDEEGVSQKSMDEAIKMATDGIKAQIREENVKRDDLVQRLSPVIGNFDHIAMALDEVVLYGVNKLQLKAPKGQEAIVLDGFLQGVSISRKETVSAFDSSVSSGDSAFSKFIAGDL